MITIDFFNVNMQGLVEDCVTIDTTRFDFNKSPLIIGDMLGSIEDAHFLNPIEISISFKADDYLAQLVHLKN